MPKSAATSVIWRPVSRTIATASALYCGENFRLFSAMTHPLALEEFVVVPKYSSHAIQRFLSGDGKVDKG